MRGVGTAGAQETLEVLRQDLHELRDDLAMSGHECPLVPKRPLRS